LVKRLGRNAGGYFGDRIDIDQVVSDIARIAADRGWVTDTVLESEAVQLLALRHASGFDRPRVYLSAGIHGDEPAGPLAVRELFERGLWPKGIDLWLCPCLNPTGFRLNRRENAEGLDLNRQYLHLRAAETRSHIAWLEKQPRFDLAICLHEDWESHGFYLYELNPDGLESHAQSMIDAVSRVCPIDPSPEIEGRPAMGGIIQPSADPRSRPEWPEAFYLFTHKTRLSYTLEAPSDFPIKTRVAALAAAVRATLESLSTRS
jgi:hypothetical protein